MVCLFDKISDWYGKLLLCVKILCEMKLKFKETFKKSPINILSAIFEFLQRLQIFDIKILFEIRSSISYRLWNLSWIKPWILDKVV